MNALVLVEVERNRQHDLAAAGKFPDYWRHGVPDCQRLTVLAEEFGEAAKEACDIMHNATREWPGEDVDAVQVHKTRVQKRLKGLLRTELVQVAAVAVAWIEALSTELGDE